MDKLCIGIVGGAGPMAGVLLVRKTIEVCQKHYGCKNDRDFPLLLLASVPFAEMLQPDSPSQKEGLLTIQLQEAIAFLLQAGAKRIAIACNTLHAFLDGSAIPQLCHLVAESESSIRKKGLRRVLVLATTTSKNKGLYTAPELVWPPAKDQLRLDCLIHDVLVGDAMRRRQNALFGFIEKQIKTDPSIEAVLLGCSELSVLMDGRHSPITLIDPLHIVARKLCS